MKNIKYFIFGILFLFINVFYVHASCTDEEISLLKEETKNIKITYKHKGAVDTGEGETYYNYFKLTAINLSDDFYVLLSKNTNKLVPVDGRIESTVYSGTWDFNIYSNKCGEKINTIEVFIPTFNTYSLDPLCEGIDGNDFELCGKYYEYYVGYEDFRQRVTAYRSIHLDNNQQDDDDLGTIINEIINNILKSLKEHKIYVLVVLTILVIFLVIIIVLKRRKKRGVLE